jgi:hypothetical protein
MAFWSKLFQKILPAKKEGTGLGYSLFQPIFPDDAVAQLNVTFVNCASNFARHISKIVPDPKIGTLPAATREDVRKVLQLRPNPIQDASTFWWQIGNAYASDNIAFIYPEFDYSGMRKRLAALWFLDLARNNVSATIAKDGSVIVEFTLEGGEKRWMYLEDLIVLQRNVDTKNLFAGVSPALSQTLSVISASYDGLATAVKAAQYIRFIIQASTNLGPDQLAKKQAEAQSLFDSNKSGVIYLNAAQELHEVQSNGKWPLAPEIETFKKDIYLYEGTNEAIVSGNYTENQWQSYYETTIEPFISQLEKQLTIHLYTDAEIAKKNCVRIITSPLQTASLTTRLQIAQTLLTGPVVVPNVINDLLYMPPIDGGDEPRENKNWNGTQGSQSQQDDPNEEPDQSDPGKEGPSDGQDD